MKKIKLLIELEYDDVYMHEDNVEGREWFFDEVLGNDLILHSNEIGDEVGKVIVSELIDCEVESPGRKWVSSKRSYDY